MSAACAICGFLGALVGVVVGVTLVGLFIAGRSDDD
jgi:hypothetical protein